VKRIVVALAAAGLMGALLTGCGGSDDKGSNPNGRAATRPSPGSGKTSGVRTTSPTTTTTAMPIFTGDYCADLKSAKNTVEVLGAASLSQDSFDQLSDVLHIVGDEAPHSVADDWKTLGDALDSISHALQTAGITFDDLDKIGQPGVPKVDRVNLRTLTHALNSLRGPGIARAQTVINLEVKSDCGFALGMGG
jgi:hypothetical protein